MYALMICMYRTNLYLLDFLNEHILAWLDKPSLNLYTRIITTG